MNCEADINEMQLQTVTQIAHMHHCYCLSIVFKGRTGVVDWTKSRCSVSVSVPINHLKVCRRAMAPCKMRGTQSQVIG